MKHFCNKKSIQNLKKKYISKQKKIKKMSLRQKLDSLVSRCWGGDLFLEAFTRDMLSSPTGTRATGE